MSAYGHIRLAIPAMLAMSLTSAAAHAEDRPATHNMLIVGSETVFLSHLPMFEKLNANQTDYTSPHRFQVILQATFHNDSGVDITPEYTRDRERNPDIKIYTLGPEHFILSRLFTPAEKPALSAFKGTVFRGHLERGGQPIDESPVTVQVEKVVYMKQFDPTEKKPKNLAYILFGDEHGLFLAHLISKPPDFDQILGVKAIGRQVTPGELARGIKIVFADRGNTASERFKPGQSQEKVRADFLSSTRALPFELQLEPDNEFYFEEGELAMPPNFDETDEERKSH